MASAHASPACLAWLQPAGLPRCDAAPGHKERADGASCRFNGVRRRLTGSLIDELQDYLDLRAALAQERNQGWRDRDDPDRAVGAVLEPAPLIRRAGAGPRPAGARARGGEDQLPPAARWQDAVTLAQRDGFLGAQRRVVQAAEERRQVRADPGDFAEDG